MWSFVNDRQCLENAHDSMVDAKAQSKVLTDVGFVPFIDCSNSIQLITEMFLKTQQNEWRKKIEPSHPVHAPWIELTLDNTLRWEPPPLHRYDGPNACPCVGPTQYIKGIVHSAAILLVIFLVYYPWPSSAKWLR